MLSAIDHVCQRSASSLECLREQLGKLSTGLCHIGSATAAATDKLRRACHPFACMDASLNEALADTGDYGHLVVALAAC
jgi:hypothetical protein